MKKILWMWFGLVVCVVVEQSIATTPLSSWTAQVDWRVLPGKYTNCTTIPTDKGILFGDEYFFECRKDSTDRYLGTSRDGSRITDSPAVQACQSVGGRLPISRDELETLAIYWDALSPEMKVAIENNYFWTSTVGPAYSVSAEGLFSRVGHIASHSEIDSEDFRDYSPENSVVCIILHAN